MALTQLQKNNQRTWVEISRKNLRHNLEVFRSLCPKAKIIWTVKANAYGHGAMLVAHEIQKSEKGEWLGVDSLDEALCLRKEGIVMPIIVLGWVPYPRLKELISNNLKLLVSSNEIVSHLLKLKNKNKLQLHLKIDTGTTRQGLLPMDAIKLAKRIVKNGLVLEGAATHFANIEDTENPTYADLQIERFALVVSALEASGIKLSYLHTACSAAVLARPETIFTACRIGISLYGLYPSNALKEAAKSLKWSHRLKPVLAWRSHVGLVKTVPANTMVGYGLTEKTNKKTTIVIVPVGYADGYDRKFSSTSSVIIKGKKCRVMGRVCMNMIIVDASNVTNVKENDIVTLLGTDGRSEISAEDLATCAKTINYEIVARISTHLPRFVV